MFQLCSWNSLAARPIISPVCKKACVTSTVRRPRNLVKRQNHWQLIKTIFLHNEQNQQGQRLSRTALPLPRKETRQSASSPAPLSRAGRNDHCKNTAAETSQTRSRHRSRKSDRVADRKTMFLRHDILPETMFAVPPPSRSGADAVRSRRGFRGFVEARGGRLLDCRGVLE